MSEKLCEFNFRGTLKAFDDVFDFNPSTHRSVLGEAATAVGRAIPGTPFTIEIRGDKSLIDTGVIVRRPE